MVRTTPGSAPRPLPGRADRDTFHFAAGMAADGDRVAKMVEVFGLGKSPSSSVSTSVLDSSRNADGEVGTVSADGSDGAVGEGQRTDPDAAVEVFRNRASMFLICCRMPGRATET